MENHQTPATEGQEALKNYKQTIKKPFWLILTPYGVLFLFELAGIHTTEELVGFMGLIIIAGMIWMGISLFKQ